MRAARVRSSRVDMRPHPIPSCLQRG